MVFDIQKTGALLSSSLVFNFSAIFISFRASLYSVPVPHFLRHSFDPRIHRHSFFDWLRIDSLILRDIYSRPFIAQQTFFQRYRFGNSPPASLNNAGSSCLFRATQASFAYRWNPSFCDSSSYIGITLSSSFPLFSVSCTKNRSCSSFITLLTHLGLFTTNAITRSFRKMKSRYSPSGFSSFPYEFTSFCKIHYTTYHSPAFHNPSANPFTFSGTLPLFKIVNNKNLFWLIPIPLSVPFYQIFDYTLDVFGLIILYLT